MSRNTIDKIIAILVGIIVWAYVIGVKDPVTTGVIKSIPVELTNISVMEGKGLAIAGTGEYTVDVVVGGNRSTINSAGATDFIAKADVSALTLGQNYILVEVESPANLTVNEIRTQKIQIYVDTAVAVEKDLKLYTANIPDGKELGGIETEFGSVVTKGAQSLVDKVAYVQAAIDAKDSVQDESVIQNIKLIPMDADGNEVIGVKLSQDNVNIKSTLFDTKEVALNVAVEGELNEHITLMSEIIPASVVVKGPKNVLDTLWQLDTEPINKSEVTESCSIPLNVIVPDGVELAHDYRNISVDYEIKGRVEQEYVLTRNEIEFANLAEGLDVNLEKNLQFKLSIYEDDIEKVKLSDIKLSIDLDGLAEGEYNLPISSSEVLNIEDASFIDLPETIKVLITKLEQPEGNTE